MIPNEEPRTRRATHSCRHRSSGRSRVRRHRARSRSSTVASPTRRTRRAGVVVGADPVLSTRAAGYPGRSACSRSSARPRPFGPDRVPEGRDGPSMGRRVMRPPRHAHGRVIGEPEGGRRRRRSQVARPAASSRSAVAVAEQLDARPPEMVVEPLPPSPSSPPSSSCSTIGESGNTDATGAPVARSRTGPRPSRDGSPRRRTRPRRDAVAGRPAGPRSAMVA